MPALNYFGQHLASPSSCKSSFHDVGDVMSEEFQDVEMTSHPAMDSVSRALSAKPVDDSIHGSTIQDAHVHPDRTSSLSDDPEAREEKAADRWGRPAQPKGVLAFLGLTVGSIGVVYGDLGTSPLYTFSSIFADFSSEPTPADIVGAMSCIFWTMNLVAILKYAFIVLYADDHGEGGTFALYSNLVRHLRIGLPGSADREGSIRAASRGRTVGKTPKRRLEVFLQRSKRAQFALLMVCLLGTCMVLGDGVLTPALTVLSAVSGIESGGPKLSRATIVGVSCAILVLTFAAQRLGTSKLGFSFAPILIIWLTFNGGIGIYNIAKYDPAVFRSMSPHYAIQFFLRNGKQGWVALGGVVLAITGTEAMFADMGHFSRGSIQLGLVGVVYPCCMLTYFGEAAFLQHNIPLIHKAYYASIPHPLFYFMLVMATLAAIVASQSLISASFSLIKQSMALGCFPRVTIKHSSAKHAGQIYIPEVNYILMVLTVVVVAGFQDVTKLGNAFGFAVIAVMLITSLLLTLVMLLVWKTPIWVPILYLSFFGSLECVYLSAVANKIPQGAWFPVALAAALLVIMYVWYYGNEKRAVHEQNNMVTARHVKTFADQIARDRPPGIGIFYTPTPYGVPPALTHLISALPSCFIPPQIVVFLTVVYAPLPYLNPLERFEVHTLPEAPGFFCVTVYYGYLEKVDHGELFDGALSGAIARHVQLEAAGFEGLEVGAEKPSGVPLAAIQAALAGGIVHVLQHATLEPSERSGIVKRYMLGAYSLLRALSCSTARSFHIPADLLLRVGVVCSA